MLLRSSPLHTLRMRRLALALIALGLLLVLVTAGYLAWKNTRTEQKRLDYLQRVFLHVPPVQPSRPPFMTAQGVEIVYAPGQTALAFAEGFQPHEPIFVRLYSRTRGLLNAYQTRADVRGQYAAARPLSLDENGKGYTPPGGLWFQVEALSGREQVFQFRLEPGQEIGLAAAKGVYPPATVPGTVVAFWCSGFQLDEDPIVKVAADGQEFRPGRIKIETYPVASDGLLLGTLVVSLDVPTGDWQLFTNHCQLDFPVRSNLNFITMGQGEPHVNHTP